MSKSIFRVFNPGAPKEDPVEKRRGQLRRAQQTYRDRKDKYTRCLENELSQTRASEAKLMREAENLRTTIIVLVGLLSEHGIDAPASAWLDERRVKEGHKFATPSESSATCQVQPQAHRTKASPVPPRDLYHVGNAIMPTEALQWTSPESISDYYPIDGQRKHTAPQLYQHQQRPSTDSWMDISEAAIFSQNDDRRLCQLDLVTIGMEFVLTLERPCLEHIHGDPNKPDDPNGHALTTSAQLLSVSPLTPSKAPAPSFQKTPTALLDRLLNLAPNLVLDGEVTPIQAWNYIRCQPHFGGLRARDLWTLAEGLRDSIQCHGFGAVVQQGIFEDLVYTTLMLGREF
ncbi:hypothetical protein B0T10DRAFT_590474 [Thelonectria olida]|uniref:BZIP domain-containing protein n=1 Tax=Thelonectria olida TaxID=1576542 RepID=A0A9P8WDL3_9HYPO|nr:hypothetical protein B0T10DRAFT_590474 [Thelonectria olida]